jgi:hypothetical protein
LVIVQSGPGTYFAESNVQPLDRRWSSCFLCSDDSP